MVFEQNLLELFTNCPLCAGRSRGHIDNSGSGHGTLIRIIQKCEEPNCAYTRTWDSQPWSNQTPVGNLMLSAAILFSGSQISQVLSLLHILNMKSYARSTYQHHQHAYVIPTVINGWKALQADLIDELRTIEGGLQLAGDCRNDSPGHSAKYGTYTLVEQTTKKVVDIQLVQVIYHAGIGPMYDTVLYIHLYVCRLSFILSIQIISIFSDVL